MGVEKVTDKERKRREEAMGNGQFTNFLLCLMPIEARKINVMKIKKKLFFFGERRECNRSLSCYFKLEYLVKIGKRYDWVICFIFF